MEISQALEHSQPGLVKRLTTATRQHQLNYRSEQTYLHWISRFVLFHDLTDPALLKADDRRLYLDYLTAQVKVSRARLNQATQALAFLYSEVLTTPETPAAA
ncbi:phage integrase N-terminal SAM-like domain-containing protein [Marinobacter confluentis]|uniref:Integrase n=1 Tax=Marinobacter confluentis TaxID=1697557 RepID=A0A4Z1C1I7_9GAMM|nr:phage integrase N-terminal SAM-like domain-containing protein [Marinobacter confluentis]TGN38872.1 integrase [Marinobacter confluentis]